MVMMGQIMFLGASTVNIFPFCKLFFPRTRVLYTHEDPESLCITVGRLPEWVPGMKWTKTIARECKALTNEMQYGPFYDVKERMVITRLYSAHLHHHSRYWYLPNRSCATSTADLPSIYPWHHSLT